MVAGQKEPFDALPMRPLQKQVSCQFGEDLPTQASQQQQNAKAQWAAPTWTTLVLIELIKSSWILDKWMIDFGWTVNESNRTYLNLDSAAIKGLPHFQFFSTTSCVLCHVSLTAIELNQNGAVEKWEPMEASKHSETEACLKMTITLIEPLSVNISMNTIHQSMFHQTPRVTRQKLTVSEKILAPPAHGRSQAKAEI